MKPARVLLVLIAALVLSSPGLLKAELLYDWNQSPLAPDGLWGTLPGGAIKNTVDDSQDIRAIDPGLPPSWQYLLDTAAAFWYVKDTAHDTHEFRLDLRGAPSMTVGQFAPQYVVLVDSAPGGASAGQHRYIPTGGIGLTGVDQIIAAEFSQTGGFSSVKIYTWNGLTFDAGVDLMSVGGRFDSEENDGKTLQWEVPFGALHTGPFQFSAATMDFQGPGDAGITYDLVGTVNMGANSIVPEPTSTSLLALGFGLALGWGWRRRKSITCH